MSETAADIISGWFDQLHPESLEARRLRTVVVEIRRLQSRIEELERALKPFADEATILDAQTRPGENARMMIGELRMKHLRQARTALEASNKGGE